ncbi:hypothetical protein NE850_24645 [Paraburkholderia sp. USG1]|nr:hypothetical protein [Paraburkholderia sp. USG1]
MKTIQVEISAACGTNGLPPQLLAQVGPAFDWHADEHNAFDLVAMTTAPPTYVGFSLADTIRLGDPTADHSVSHG